MWVKDTEITRFNLPYQSEICWCWRSLLFSWSTRLGVGVYAIRKFTVFTLLETHIVTDYNQTQIVITQGDTYHSIWWYYTVNVADTNKQTNNLHNQYPISCSVLSVCKAYLLLSVIVKRFSISRCTF